MFETLPSHEQCSTKFVSVVALVLTVLVILCLIPISLNPAFSAIHVVYIESSVRPEHVCNSKFLSVALDSSLLADGFANFHLKNLKLRNMIKNLSPGYLRVGGTTADRLIFARKSSQYKTPYLKKINIESVGSVYESSDGYKSDLPNFTFTDEDWLEMYNLAVKTRFIILFDLNSLMRNSDGSWNSTNAEELIHFSSDNNMNVIWQLGNEPNSYKSVFNYTVNARQLARDFKTLKEILNKFPLYKDSILVGPDITNPAPENPKSISYLNGFLNSGGGDSIDAITFHQYYFNGKTVESHTFLDPNVFDLLLAQIDVVKSLVSYYNQHEKPIWLTETADGYGGGAPGYSNRYIGTFIWLDKLGVAAKMGLDVVVRQTLYKGFYALIDNDYEPTPNYWVSVIYKTFVGPEVIPCMQATSDKVRMYCHCTNKKFKRSAITLFGINLKGSDAFIRIEGLSHPQRNLDEIYAYVLSPFITLLSRDMYLNGELLFLGANGTLPPFKPVIINDEIHVMIPAFCSAFFVIPSDIVACK